MNRRGRKRGGEGSDAEVPIHVRDRINLELRMMKREQDAAKRAKREGRKEDQERHEAAALIHAARAEEAGHTDN
jgi:hypothetical protein